LGYEQALDQVKEKQDQIDQLKEQLEAIQEDHE